MTTTEKVSWPSWFLDDFSVAEAVSKIVNDGVGHCKSPANFSQQSYLSAAMPEYPEKTPDD